MNDKTMRKTVLWMGILQMANGQSAIGKANAEHYTWGHIRGIKAERLYRSTPAASNDSNFCSKSAELSRVLWFANNLSKPNVQVFNTISGVVVSLWGS